MEPKIKIFEGYDLNKLMHQIKENLGEEFKILYQNEIKEKTKIPFFKKTKYILIVEPIENKISFEDILSENLEEENKKEEVQVYNPFKAENKQEIVEKTESVIKTTVHNDLNQKLNIKEEYYDNNITYKEITEEFTGKALDLINLLIQKDVELDVAKEIVRNACGLEMGSNKLDLKHFTYRESLIEGIEKSFIFKGDIFKDSDRRRVVAFLGPTGVGKTTNLFKVASKLILEENKKVAVVSIDTFKAGAGDQARSYCNILGIPFQILSDPKKLRETVDDLDFVDVILIDTVGRSHYDHWKLGEIKETLRLIDEIEYMMVVSCNWKNKESYNLIQKYRKFFNISYLFFTKIDETAYPGTILNLAYKTKLPLTYISTGQNVPEDLKIITPERLASYLLMENE
ncbi:MAG TPA: flagellar biosynthesis protein FlhF [Sulfurihydrogenibium sp.]|uniref:flagellar biosynthesis protein FlhF n=1 Tax=Sulfurihydrogenibium sp. (strain YO3AOP1) TaxID=436114 RepID=UPI000172672C|nr:flagellar biosynthesis protein FlhF [Sulfurihydrogenibium sp. YO3AOP1]ACD67248.1 GTP-binding signal recognition particle SRP54 G- domain [Sulfurihydrogenibium sp. YO3AOP1]HBT98581.1 flagellar biosynthesis protein FlhF [Sulfurihydrogenibium sp.]